MEKEIYVIERIWNISKIPVSYLDSGENILYSKGYEQVEDPVIGDVALRNRLLNRSDSNAQMPLLKFNDKKYVYGIFNDLMDCHVILGPVCIETNRSKLFKEDIETNKYIKILDEFCSVLSLLYYLLAGEMVNETDILSNVENMETGQLKKYELQKYILDNKEQEISRYSYTVEQNHMRNIIEGNPDAIRNQKEVPSTQKVGILAKSTYKQYEYMACAAITLAARAAIQGGLEPPTAYAVGDLAKQNLEQCKTIGEMMTLQRNVRIDFAERVKEIKERGSSLSYIEKCKVYIVNHLNVHFQLEDIADEIGINKSYLSRRFTEEIGIGIQKYTQIERLKAASNMLKYSDESISNISNYLCFPSQSHFGKVFKDYTGMTPQKYRNREKTIDF